ncbi:MAG: hypothetical protein KF784_00090 [Fimbriimonadaceae bacterium]|nr:hypothetical protein [Fimbriimonadaceae bacterium]
MSPETPPRRSLPYEAEPGYYEDGRLWLYGNVRLLQSELAYLPNAAGLPGHTKAELDELEKEAERLVLAGRTLVVGIHSPAHQRTALVPLRWSAPRIVVMSGGFRRHLGPNLDREPFRGRCSGGSSGTPRWTWRSPAALRRSCRPSLCTTRPSTASSPLSRQANTRGYAPLTTP